MVMKLIAYFSVFVLFGVLFILQDACTTPIYDPISKKLVPDEYGRSVGRLISLVMIIIAFLFGIFLG